MTTSRINKTFVEKGWEDGLRYATGTKQVRREIRQRIAKAYRLGTSERELYLKWFFERIEGIAEGIEAGRLPRTIRPRTLRYVANGYLEAHPAA